MESPPLSLFLHLMVIQFCVFGILFTTSLTEAFILDYSVIIVLTCLSLANSLRSLCCSKVLCNQSLLRMSFVLHGVLLSLLGPARMLDPSLWRRKGLPFIMAMWCSVPAPGLNPQWSVALQGPCLVSPEPGTGPGSQEALMKVCWTNHGSRDQKMEG